MTKLSSFSLSLLNRGVRSAQSEVSRPFSLRSEFSFYLPSKRFISPRCYSTNSPSPLPPPLTTSSLKIARVELQAPVGCDIGGSFVKVAYLREDGRLALGKVEKNQQILEGNQQDNEIDESKELFPRFVKQEKFHKRLPLQLQPDKHLTVDSPLDGVVRFLKFPTSCVSEFIQFLIDHQLRQHIGNITQINATGGGAYKFGKTVKTELGIDFIIQDEMKTLVTGINFLLQNFEDQEIFTVDPSNYQKQFLTLDERDLYPFILVSVGSGVSILKVDARNQFQRISGSAIGGGTFWGLCRMLTNLESYEDLTKAIDQPEYSTASLDLLVGDIYGGDYAELGLKADLVASSFGKAGTSPTVKYDPVAIAKSLLFMTGSNIAQIAFLNAMHHNVKRLIFSGGFVHQNPLLWKRLSSGIDFWSRGEMKAHFLVHDGYLGALGALVSNSKIVPF